jgi:iron complex outermembrane recepter protein
MGAALSLVISSFAEEREEVKKRFKLAEGNAARTLKQAARQGRVDIVFSADVVSGVKTQAIKGEYTPREAFNLMLKNSRFVAVKHRKSGVYLIKEQDPTDVN